MSSRSSTTLNSVANRLRRLVPVIVIVAAFTAPAAAQEGTYQSARQSMMHGNTEDAIRGFCSLGDYRDAAQMCRQLQAQLNELSRRNEASFQNGVRAFQNGNYAAARQAFEQVTGPRYDAAQDYLNNRIPAAMKQPSGSKPP